MKRDSECRTSVLWIVSLLGVFLFAGPHISQAKAISTANDLDGLEVFEQCAAFNTADSACPLCWWVLRVVFGRAAAARATAVRVGAARVGTTSAATRGTSGLVGRGNASRWGSQANRGASRVRGSASPSPSSRYQYQTQATRGAGRSTPSGAARMGTTRSSQQPVARNSRSTPAKGYRDKAAARRNELQKARSQGRAAATSRPTSTVRRGAHRSTPNGVSRTGTTRQTQQRVARNPRRTRADSREIRKTERLNKLQEARSQGYAAAPSRSVAARGTGRSTNGGVSQGAKAYKHSFKYADRVRKRAIADPLSHNFPYSFDDAILATKPMLRKNGYKIFRLTGNMNGKNGVFEIGLTRDGVIDHRFFRPLK